MAGLLDAYPGLSAGSNIDLNQLVRPPDPLGAALGEISQRLAVAGQASRLPVSTLGALGSALGGASTAAQTQQTQYLDQAIKLQALRRALQQAGIDERLAPLYYQIAQRALAGGAAPVAPAAALGAPGAPGAPAAAPAVPGVPAAAPGAPAAPGPSLLPGDAGAASARGEYGSGQSTGAPPGFTLSFLPPGSPGTVTIGGQTYAPPGAAPLKTTGLLGAPDPVISSAGGPGAGAMLASFRPESLVGPAGGGDGSGAGPDPLDLIAKYESGGRNIRQQVVPESVSSASGPWQMLDSTFHETAKKAGIDTSQYDSAKDAPIETQRAVAQALYNEKGFAPWANYNPKLAAAIGGGTPTGGTASPVSTLRGLLAGSDGGSSDPLAGLLALASGGTSGNGGEDPLAGLLKSQDEVIPSGGGLPAGMLRNAALGAGNAGYPIPNILPPGGNAAFPALPATGDNQIPIAGPGAPNTVIPNDLPADAQQVGDRLIGGPSTRRPGMMLAQYAPGGAAPAAGGGAAPGADLATIMNGLLQQQATSSTGGVIPGLGITPQAVAALNALSTLAGHTTPPLKEFLDLYYKDPAYLQDVARAGQLGKSQVDLQFAPMIAGLTALAQAPGLKLQAEDKAAIDRVTDFLKQRTGAQLAEGTITINGPNGPIKVPVTGLQRSEALGGPLVAPAGTPKLPAQPLPSSLGSGTPGTQAAPGAANIPTVGSIYGEPIKTPAEIKQDEAAQADFSTNVTPPFQAGQKALFALTQIENALQNYQTGSGRENYLDLQKKISSFADLVGIPQTDSFRKGIASGEIIRKSGNALGFELANSLLGKGESGNVVNQAIQSNPGLSVTPGGNQQLIALIKQGIQRDFDKHAFYNQWFGNHRTYVGADDAFNAANPVDTYVNRVLPSQGASPKMKYNPQTQQLEPL